MRKLKIPILCFIAALTMLACNKKAENKVMGLKPIYASNAVVEKVEAVEKQSLESPGKIYVYENLLLINDKSKGIHIYDNTNTKNPIHLSFISIPGNMDFSVNEGMIYADNITDMVIIDITNPASPVFTNRIDNVFPVQQFPDEFGAFECVDASKGTVIGWEKTILENPKCFR